MATAKAKPTPKKATSGRTTPKKRASAAELIEPRDLVIERGMLTYGERIEIEQITNKPWNQLSWPDGTPTAECAVAVLYARLRRRQPDLTYEEVLALPIDFDFKVVGDEPGPTRAARRTKR